MADERPFIKVSDTLADHPKFIAPRRRGDRRSVLISDKCYDDPRWFGITDAECWAWIWSLTKFGTHHLLFAEDDLASYLYHRRTKQSARSVARVLVSADLWTVMETPKTYIVTPNSLWKPGPVEGVRASIPDSLRQSVYARDGFACKHCGATKDLSLDHIHPWSRGGSDDDENLQTLCMPCNIRKGATV